MGKIEGNFAKLRGLVEELSIKAEESKKTSEHIDDAIQPVINMKLQTKQDYSVYLGSIRNSIAADLEFFRDISQVVRKVSPETSDYIDKEVLKLEELFRKFADHIRQTADAGSSHLKQNADDIIQLANVEIPKQLEIVSLLIYASNNVLEDTLRFIEKE